MQRSRKEEIIIKEKNKTIISGKENQYQEKNNVICTLHVQKKLTVIVITIPPSCG